MFSWISFLTYAVVTAITPGPNNIMSMSNANRLGFVRALPFNLGVWTAFSVVMVLGTIFCTSLSSIIPMIEFPMLILGAVYILYLAYSTWKSEATIKEKNTNIGFKAGFILQFINPKIYVYCIVSMQAYILPYYKDDALMLLFFALLLAFIGFVCTLLWSGFGSVFKILFSKHAKITNAIMSLLLVYCAISFFL